MSRYGRPRTLGALAFLVLFSFTMLAVTCSDKSESAQSFSGRVQWTILGPFDNTGSSESDCQAFQKDHLIDLGGEASVTSPELPGIPKGEGEKLFSEKGYLNFSQLYPGKTWSVAYAYLEFEDSGGERFFRMGSDDGIRVWLNGELALEDHAHRSMVATDDAFYANLKKGKNRILIECCQGSGEWELSAALLTREENEAFIASTRAVSICVTSSPAIIGEGNNLSFTVATKPGLGIGVSFDYSLADDSGRAIASGLAVEGRKLTLSLPEEYTGSLSLRVIPGSGIRDDIAAKLKGAILEKVFIKGDSTAIFNEYAAKARKAAKEISRTLSDTLDIESSLLFLADRLEGKLLESLQSPELRIIAVRFVNDLLAAIKKGPEALSAMPGYRQMAYRSSVDESLQPYSLYIPESYSKEKKYSLVVMIHGYSGEEYTWGNYIASLKPDDFIVLSAFGRGDMYYRSIGERDVLDAMDRVISRYSIDANKVYLIGNSMGGMGTWQIGALYPDRFAAIVPISGRTGTAWLANLGNLKTFVIHGGADKTVPVYFDRTAVETLKSLSYDVSYEEIPNGSHSSWLEWSSIHDPREIFDFFRSATRDPSPKKISAAIPYARYGHQYWVTVDELDTSGPIALPALTNKSDNDDTFPLVPKPGSFTATRISESEISIATLRVNALTIDLSQAGIDTSKPVKIAIDEAIIEVAAGAEKISLAKTKAGLWGIEASPASSGLPRHDGGGIADLFTSPVYIVYGTADASRRPYLEMAATKLADWSWRNDRQIGSKIGRFRVKSDTELTDEEMRGANIILIGNKKENLVSRRLASVFEPYYSGSSILVGGTRFDSNGLCLVSPNPLAPGRIVGYFDIPASFLPTLSNVEAWFDSFPFRLRNYYSSELQGYPGFCPDIMVLTKNPFRDAWSIWFDRYWANLKGNSL